MCAWDAKIGNVWVKLDLPPATGDGGTSASGLWTFQNSTPTDIRFQNSEPGFGDTAPYSAHTYANQAGSIGKLSEVQAPADLARPYLCDLDNSHPGFLAPRLTWDKAPTVSFDTAGGSAINGIPLCVVDTAWWGIGTLGTTAAGQVWWWWFNPTTRNYEAATRCALGGGVQDAHLPAAFWSNRMRALIGRPVIHQCGYHVWCPVFQVGGGGGAIDLLLPFASQTPRPETVGANATTFWHIMTFGQNVISFEQTDPTGVNPGMTISLRNPDTLAVYTPTTLSGQEASPELGNTPIRVNVPNVVGCHPPIVYSGAVYFATDREVMKVVYDDQNARLLVVPINTTFTRITGNPSFFQGSMFVPSGNTLWKWTPGQLEFTGIPIDSFGDMPQDRGGGMITATMPTANNLLIGMQSAPAAAWDSCVLRMDTNNVVGILDFTSGDAAVSARQSGWIRPGSVQLINYFIDTSDLNPVIGIVCGDLGSAKRVVTIREGNRDAVFLPAANRHQVAGPHHWISAIDPGTNYADFKQALKVSAAVADVNTTAYIRVLYQTDTEINWPVTTVPGLTATQLADSVLANTGTWHVAMVLDGTASVTPPWAVGGWGGSSGYQDASLLVPELGYRQVRWAVEIVGDPGGTLYPRLLGFKAYYSETPAMYIVHSMRIRLMVGDPDLAGAPGDAYATPPTTTDEVYHQFNELYSYAKNGTFVPLLDPSGDSRLVKITKFIFNGIDLRDSPTHQPVLGLRRFDKIVLQLAMQEAASAA